MVGSTVRLAPARREVAGTTIRLADGVRSDPEATTHPRSRQSRGWRTLSGSRNLADARPQEDTRFTDRPCRAPHPPAQWGDRSGVRAQPLGGPCIRARTPSSFLRDPGGAMKQVKDRTVESYSKTSQSSGGCGGQSRTWSLTGTLRVRESSSRARQRIVLSTIQRGGKTPIATARRTFRRSRASSTCSSAGCFRSMSRPPHPLGSPGGIPG